MNVREVLDFAKKNKVQVVDMKFVDLIGTWQHFTIPVSELTEGLFKDGRSTTATCCSCRTRQPLAWIRFVRCPP